MRQCWSEGLLRAYLDRELPPEDMLRVAAHLGECHRCEARRAESAATAAHVSALMNAALPEPELVTSLPLIPRPAPAARRWVVAAAALAAAVAIAFLLAPKPVTPPVAPVVLPPVSSVTAVRSAVPADAKSPALARAIHHPRRPPARAQAVADYYLALDDEPIVTGVVVRVALGPTEVPADMIFDQDGRARAIRLVK